MAFAVVGVCLLWISPAYAVGLAHTGDLAPVIGGEGATGSVTLELFVLLVGGSAFAIVRRPSRLPGRLIFYAPLLFSFALLAAMIFRLPGSPGGDYGSRKVEYFLLVNIALLTAGIVAGTRREDIARTLAVMLAVATTAAVILLDQIVRGVQPLFEGRYAISNEDYDPIALGRLAGSGILIALFALVATRSRYRVLAAVALPLLAIALLASGGRASVLGVVAGLAVLLTVPGILVVRRAAIFLAIAATTVLAAQVVPGVALDRALSVISGSAGGQDAGDRIDLWSQAWRTFANHPVDGVGTGGFLAVNPSDRYPHNLVLEVAAELGMIGLVPLVLALATGAIVIAASIRRSGPRERGLAALVAALLASAFVNAMFSTDITANYDVWLFLGLGLGLASRISVSSRRDPA
jgi:O-antigen ligase